MYTTATSDMSILTTIVEPDALAPLIADELPRPQKPSVRTIYLTSTTVW